MSSAAYCWYNNNPEYKDNYGALYNWYVVNTGLLCPVGWHVPSKEEWETLINYVGGEYVAGDKLKDPSFWFCPPGYMVDCSGTNESGFTARPGGCRNIRGNFAGIGYFGIWITSVYRDGLEEYYWSISIGYEGNIDISINSASGRYAKAGYSIRCIKNN